MDDLQKMDVLTMGHDEKYGFEGPQILVTPSPTRRANLTRFLSQKLLTWGVEARGTCYILDLERGHVLIKERDVR
jgi:hypothetical protein